MKVCKWGIVLGHRFGIGYFQGAFGPRALVFGCYAFWVSVPWSGKRWVRL